MNLESAEARLVSICEVLLLSDAREVRGGCFGSGTELTGLDELLVDWAVLLSFQDRREVLVFPARHDVGQ